MTTRVLLTCDAVPDDTFVERVFTMVQLTKRVKLTSDAIDPDEMQDALDRLAIAAPPEANAVIGVRLATTSVVLGDSVYLYLTYTGTPAKISDRS